MVITMRQRPPGSGRRSKGPRDVMTTRLPTTLADAVRAYADQHELSYSDAIANVLAEHFGEPLVAPLKGESQLQMTA